MLPANDSFSQSDSHNNRKVTFIRSPELRFIDEIKNARPWKTRKRTIFIVETTLSASAAYKSPSR